MTYIDNTWIAVGVIYLHRMRVMTATLLAWSSVFSDGATANVIGHKKDISVKPSS